MIWHAWHVFQTGGSVGTGPTCSNPTINTFGEALYGECTACPTNTFANTTRAIACTPAGSTTNWPAGSCMTGSKTGCYSPQNTYNTGS